MADKLWRIPAVRHKGTGKWKSGLPAEVRFWEQFLAEFFGRRKHTFPEDWFDEFKDRIDPTYPLQPWVTSLLAPQQRHSLAVLDVGSGPFTVLGKTYAAHSLHITAVDPLAREYRRILAELREEQLVPVIVGGECDYCLSRVDIRPCGGSQCPGSQPRSSGGSACRRPCCQTIVLGRALAYRE